VSERLATPSELVVELVSANIALAGAAMKHERAEAALCTAKLELEEARETVESLERDLRDTCYRQLARSMRPGNSEAAL
jgi:hypothetical protein